MGSIAVNSPCRIVQSLMGPTLSLLGDYSISLIIEDLFVFKLLNALAIDHMCIVINQSLYLLDFAVSRNMSFRM